ncbi:Zn-dependent exopeptidase [Hypoxylon sp. FL1284]|nr:Zn-dependent exopeptidase [Hypoxylon sp. FL1284]
MRSLSQEDAEKLITSTPDVDRLRAHSKQYSAQPHLAGDLPHAERIRDLWRSYGIPAELTRYDVLQNFPGHAALTLHREDGDADDVAFEASLIEDEIPENPTSAPTNGLPSAFLGLTAHGAARRAELVYVNFGTRADFAALASRGVSARGRVALCRYGGGVLRGLKLRAAERAGAAAVVLYGDPAEDGACTEANGYKAYPHGPARHPAAVQRGSVDYFSVGVGDPTTPGYPSLPGGGTERRDPRAGGAVAVPRIPALPVSFRDALPFLRALNGCGPGPAELGTDWAGALDGVEYCAGPARARVTLVSEGEYRYSPIYNVTGTIQGSTDECVILGNHHDSWCCGAVDPVSGSAAMNEVARGLGSLMRRNWRPYRKIILASWDDEEYGLVGSTEFGEDHASWLTENCVAYINVDEATNGGKFLGAYGSPFLTHVLRAAASAIPSPVNESKTVYDDWLALQQEEATDPANPPSQPTLTIMGTGSDYTVFLHHLGIPSLDLLFNQRGDAVYPYHSNYDSYYWVDRFGDPGFAKHLAMARLWGLVVVKLAGAPVLPFRGADYAEALGRHLGALRARNVPGLGLEPLEMAVSRFEKAMTALDTTVHRGEHEASRQPQSTAREANKTHMQIERSFLREDGLPGRPWYKHLIFAPGLWTGYDGVAFPSIAECLEDGDIEGANMWIREIAKVIEKACAVAGGAGLV